MLAIATVLAAIFLSLLITRIATIALAVTGLSKESARFQARSAFNGVGFTTSEAEMVVNHPLRRRIVLTLMLLGNAGLVTILASLLISFAGAEGATEARNRIALLLGGLFVLFLLAKSRYADRIMTRIITSALGRFTTLDVRDYAGLLQLGGGFGVIELAVQKDHWITGKSLAEMDLRREGIAVLGVQRADHTFIGVPKGSIRIEERDTLILYGHTDLLNALACRKQGPEGDAEHEEALATREDRPVP